MTGLQLEELEIVIGTGTEELGVPKMGQLHTAEVVLVVRNGTDQVAGHC